MALATTFSLVAVVALSACGSSSKSSSAPAASSPASSSTPAATSTPSTSTTATKTGGTVTLLMGTFPQSLDPGLDYTTQGSETNWVVYTGLTTYAHANGTAGAQLIPGLATALPVISDGGKTYTATLRSGLVYSDGSPVKASDFLHTVERAIKIPWGGSGSFITPNIVGATAYSTGKAKTISGISTNDSTGQIVIHLTQAYGPFDNVLAFPALGFVPPSTPFKVEPTSPPPGVGPYMVKSIVANQSFLDVPNPQWSKVNIPGIPPAKVSVQVKIDSNVTANALAVLNNSADFFDWADSLPGNLIAQITSQAKGRFNMVNLGGSTYYVFLNSSEPPFNNQLAREAVVTGLNQDAMSRLGSGTLVPACYFLPPDVPGHPTAPCPYGTPGLGDLAKAKALVKQSGLAGANITVWSEERTPRLQWMTYYTSFLNSIGFHATLKSIADATYFTTIGNSKSIHPQTGFADWNQDFPNPDDFYGPLLDGKSILPQNNENFGQTNDPYVNAQVAKLGATPTTQISTVAAQWQALDEYVAKKALAGVFGYQKFPEFASDRINYGALVFQPIYGWDFTSFALK
jgi:peptide/nickel transport system substrate-binding protein